MVPYVQRFARGAVLSGVLLLVTTGSIWAQPAPVSRCGDEAAAVAPDSAAATHNELEYAFYTLLFAPPLILSTLDARCEESGSSLGFWNQNVSVSLSTGYLTNGDQEPSEGFHGGGHLAAIEFLLRGYYGELRLEQYSIGDGISLQTFRLGYLAHPIPRVAVGATVGYRRGRGELWETTGIEVGLPIVYAFGESTRSGWVRWEPTYVATSSRLVLAPRMLAELPLWRTPFVARIGIDVKGIRAADPVVFSSGIRLRI